MRVGVWFFAGLILCTAAAPALGGITVTSYTTTAETNAYAPVSKAQYFDQQTLTNVSPAVANVSDDWTGTNVGGTTTTWHWIGASHTETTTTFDASTLAVTGTGSFSYDMTTTSDFVDPIRSGGVYTPTAFAEYECHFTLDVPATYHATGALNGFGIIGFGSSEFGDVFRLGSNSGSFDRTGTIPAGHYGISLNTGNSMGQLPSAPNHRALSGMFTVPDFTITVPEPAALPALISVLTLGPLSRRLRRGSARSRRFRQCCSC